MKNIKNAYVISFLWRNWYWLGIWIFYYLRFTDYAGIGFLETVMITTSALGEIPTGAIADIVGKRKAVMLAFTLGAIGNIMMAFAPNYIFLIISILTMTLGSAFYSGSLEALVYDTLKEQKLESTFQSVIGKMNSMQNIGMAVAGIAGGYLYKVNISLPFLMVAFVYIIGIFVSFNLKEPDIDSEKYSWKVFIAQNKEGFVQLFNTNKKMWTILLLLIPSAFMVATENVVNDATVIELGYSSIGFGYFATLLYLFGTLISMKSDVIISKLGPKYVYFSLLFIYVLTLLLIPKFMIIVGSILLFVRYGVQTIFDNYQSAKINEIADSRYRATTLSTYNLIRNIPYVFGATGIGILMNMYTAKTFSLYFGILFMITVILVYMSRVIFEKR